MIRFCCYILVAIIALVGPRSMGLVGDASASFHGTAIDSQDSSRSNTETSKSGAGAEIPATPAKPVPKKVDLRFGFNMPADSGAGSPSSSTHNFSSSGVLAVTSEELFQTSPAVTRLRLAELRVATISTPRSVFEPPRVYTVPTQHVSSLSSANSSSQWRLPGSKRSLSKQYQQRT